MALTDNKAKIQALIAGINALPEAGSGEPAEPVLQEKSVTPSESAQTVKPDTGYDGLSQVSVGAISETYVGSSVPKQAAQTITPGTSNKTIASGRYLTGTQTIKGDANLVAGNIKSGVSIFGVAGSLTEGEDVSAETAEYTELLTDLETAIDALPDAGSGGDKTPGTCTVEIQNVTESIAERTIYVDGLLYETVTNGEKDIYIQEEANAFEIGQGESAYINNVLHGGLFILFDSDAYDGIANIKEITTTNAEYLGKNHAGSFVFRIGDADAIIEVSK